MTVRTRALLLLAIAAAPAGIGTRTGASGGGADLLVPGVSLRSIDFAQGAFVEYLVVTETDGVRDTSTVSLRVLSLDGGEAEIEIVSAPHPPVAEETIAIRVVMRTNVREAETEEQFRRALGRVLVGEGTEPFREATAEELGDFDLGRLFIESREGMEERILPEEELVTPAGAFDCSVRDYRIETKRPVSLGGVAGEKTESRQSTLWISGRVPFWGLVRSRVEQRSAMKIAGRNPFGDPRPRSTVTESILSGYEFP